MDRVEFACPACRCTVLAPASLAGYGAACPKCKNAVSCWPAPESLVASPELASTMRTPNPREIPRRLTALCLVAVILFGVVLIFGSMGALLGWFKRDVPAEWTTDDLVKYLNSNGITVEVHPTENGRGVGLYDRPTRTAVGVIKTPNKKEAEKSLTSAQWRGADAFSSGSFIFVAMETKDVELLRRVEKALSKQYRTTREVD